MPSLTLQGVCKGFDHPVLDRLSLEVAEGEFFVVVGPSGVGKTTLLRCVAGLEALDGGRVLIGGRDVTNERPYRRNVAMTFESYALYPHLTVYENIASPLRARKVPKDEIDRRVRAAAKLLRIDPLLERRPGEVSGGQKQRTALGRTLVARPDAFLLDEPISHLDAKIRHELRQQFHHLDELRRTATLYVTHDYAEALSLGDRIGVMGAGNLVQVGTPHEVFRHPNHVFVARHLGQPTINEVPAELHEAHGRLHVWPQDALPFAVPEGQRAALNGNGRRAVTLGLRPQYLRALQRGEPASGRYAFDGTVEVFEALGAHGVLIARVGGQKLTALTPVERHYAAGEPVSLAFDPASCLYFCPERGVNLVG